MGYSTDLLQFNNSSGELAAETNSDTATVDEIQATQRKPFMSNLKIRNDFDSPKNNSVMKSEFGEVRKFPGLKSSAYKLLESVSSIQNETGERHFRQD